MTEPILSTATASTPKLPISSEAPPTSQGPSAENILEENLTAWTNNMKNGEIHIQVRNLVEWSGYHRRRGGAERLIQEALDKLKLTTYPDFRDLHISGVVILRKTEQTNVASAAVVESSQEKAEIDRDAHILKVGRLEAANRKPVSVSQGCTISDATSLMMKYNFSQLPVMANERKALGIVSWQSIAVETIKSGKMPERVDDCLAEIKDVPFDATLFDTISTILDQECVLVRKQDNTISGIITAADLGIQFSEMSDAFLKIGQIETILRIIIEKYYPIQEIKEAKDPNDTSREVKSVDDLTFGEYKRLFENQEKWNKYFQLKISRKIFIDTLEEVRTIRNDVMHFDPVGIEDEDLKTLSTAFRFLSSIKEML